MENNNSEIGDDDDSGYSSGAPFSLTDINELLGETRGINSSILLSMVNSEHDNPLRQSLINYTNNALHSKLKNKEYACGTLVIPEQLTTDEQLHLSSDFNDIKLIFTNRTANSHAYAAASRKCERIVLLNKLRVNLKNDNGGIILKEVGGDIVTSTLNGEKGLHCCSPILSSYDSTRFTNRLYRARVELASGLVLNNYQLEVLKSFSNCTSELIGNQYFCFNRSQDCEVNADGLLFLHSNYDISLSQLGRIMDGSRAMVAYGSFVYDSRIITDDHGTIPWINAQFVIKRNALGLRQTITFGFKGCDGFNYSHNYNNYISYLTRSQFKSPNGNYFSLELLENRSGVQFFRVTRMYTKPGKATTHRLYLTHLKDKYLIRFPYCTYFYKHSNLVYPTNGNTMEKKIRMDNSFWSGLPFHTKWVYYEVDADVVDRTCAYVLGATEDKFKPEQIVTYLRSITTREVMYQSVIVRRELPQVDQLVCLAYAIYVTLYHLKYVYGKSLQQAIINTNSLRTGKSPKTVLDEFRRYRYTGFIRMLLDFLGWNYTKFEPRKLIVTPSEYIEFSSDSETSTGLSVDSDLPISDFVGTVTEDLLTPFIGSNPSPICKQKEKVKKNVAPFLGLTEERLKRGKKFFKNIFGRFVNRPIEGQIDYSVKVAPVTLQRQNKRSKVNRDPYAALGYIRYLFDDESEEGVSDKLIEEESIPSPPDNDLTEEQQIILVESAPDPPTTELSCDHGFDGECIEFVELFGNLAICDLRNFKVFIDIPISFDFFSFFSIPDSNVVKAGKLNSNCMVDLVIAGASDVLLSGISLGENGILVMKCKDMEQAKLQAAQLSEKFSRVKFFIPYHRSNEVLYLVALGFNGLPCLIEDYRTSSGECNVDCCMKQLKRTPISDSNGYPRLGSFNSGTKLIDVDGSRLECCFLAVCEDRSIDVPCLKKKFMDIYNPSPGDDLYSELQPRNYAGTAFLQVFSDYYNVRIIIQSSYPTVSILPKNPDAVFRTITLKLVNEHYYIVSNCNEGSIVNYRRDAMFEPLNLLALKTRLKKILNIQCLPNLQGLKKSNKPGTYFLNNLTKYCNLHDGCRNNNMQKYLTALASLNNPRIFLVLLFEEKNFDVFLAKNLCRDLNVSFFVIDISVEGYMVLNFYLSPVAVNSEQLVVNLQKSRVHVCAGGRYVNIRNGIIESCNRDPKNVFEGKVDNPDLTINIRRSSLSENLVEHRSATMITFNGKGTISQCDNLLEIMRYVVSFIGHFKPSEYYLVQVNSYFTNIDFLVKLLSTRSITVYVYTEPKKNALVDLSFDFFPTTSEINRRKNSMLEAYSIWYYERYSVNSTLASIYDVMVNSVVHGLALTSKIDNSACLFDLLTGKFVMGIVVEPPFNWGYSGKGLVNTQELFDRKGKVTEVTLKKFRAINPDLRYIVFNSTSKMVHGIELSKIYTPGMVKDLKSNPLTFIQGVPGAGKTRYILEHNKNSVNNLILTVTREAREDMQRRAKESGLKIHQDRIKTIDSFLLNYNPAMTVDAVWIDEASLVHCGDWCWIQYISGCKEMFVVGDKAQIPYINRSGMEIHYSLPVNWDYKQIELSIDYRNPLDIVNWLHTEKFYSFDVFGTSGIFNSVSLVPITGIGNIPLVRGAKYLTFTQSEKQQLEAMKQFDVNTIHEFQGSQADDVILVRLNTKEANVIYKSTPHILVALTRHKKTFAYCTVLSKDATSLQVLKISEYNKMHLTNRQLTLRAGYRSDQPDGAVVLYKQDRFIRDHLQNNMEFGYVSWKYYNTTSFLPLAMDFSSMTDLFPSVNVLQEFHDRVFPSASSEFREYDHDNFEYNSPSVSFPGLTTALEMPFHKRYDRLVPAIRSTVQHPLHQSQKVSVKAFFERNGQVPQLQGLVATYSLANDLLSALKRICPIRENFAMKPILPDVKNLTDWLSRQPPCVRKILDNEETLIDHRFTLYDFIIKTIPKIDLELGAEFR